MFSVDKYDDGVLNKILDKIDDRSFGVYYETYLTILMKHLNAKEAFLCEMRFVKGLSVQEIAEILQIRVETVNTRLSRLKKKMEKIIKEDIPYV